ncbi:MAG: hypothetical protein NTW60_02480 [Candidatus Wolfebacteria bacterium]|nr:hypothetical protein [Candidatus Wolfebacteria bacterium]
MSLSNLGFFQRVKTSIVCKLFPLKSADAVLLDNIEVSFKEASVTQINILSLSIPQEVPDFFLTLPEISPDLSLPIGEIEELDIHSPYVHVVNCQNNYCRKVLRLSSCGENCSQPLYVTCPTCRKSFVYTPTVDVQFQTELPQEPIEDFTSWLKDQLFCPDIKSFPMRIGEPDKTGKAYANHSYAKASFQTRRYCQRSNPLP